MLTGIPDQLMASAQIELAHQVIGVGVYGADADHQLIGDFFVAVAIGQQSCQKTGRKRFIRLCI